MAFLMTYQDYQKAAETEDGKLTFVLSAIEAYRRSELYRTAIEADLYDTQQNVTINEYVKTLYSMSGVKVQDFTSSNHRISSSFFHRLNTQRAMYSLGAGVSFLHAWEPDGEDVTKDAMGTDFDHVITEAAYDALIHGVSYCFFNFDHVDEFRATEFVPLWDEHDGSLRGGIRFWQLTPQKPMTAVLYEEDGYTVYETDDSSSLVQTAEKRAYTITYSYTEADAEPKEVGQENYGPLPIVPMWASRSKLSTLVGMKSAIDAYDLIRSGFANDMTDCAEIYWIVRNAGGMDDAELAEFRDRLKLHHIAAIDGSAGSDAEPYTQEIPYQARKEFLAEIRSGIYEDFGALDVHTVAAGATNDHIDAAYQPLDENAAAFEYWVGKALKQLAKLAGYDDTPVFQRTRISNQKEQVDMVVAESPWLDNETILRKLPNITPAEVSSIMASVTAADMSRLMPEEE